MNLNGRSKREGTRNSYAAHPIVQVLMTGIFRSRLRLALLGMVMAVPLLCLAAKEFSMPKVQPAFSYPAHDHHGTENVTVGLDPYDNATKGNIFVVNYRDHDLLPVLLVVTNDSNEPVQLSGIKAELVTADGTKLSPATEDDLYRRISHPKASGARIPIPFPTKRVKGGVGSKEWNEIQSAQFKARAVEPLSSHFFSLIFPVSQIHSPGHVFI